MRSQERIFLAMNLRNEKRSEEHMSGPELIAAISAIADRCGLTYTDVAVASGVAPQTWKYTRETGRIPSRRTARARLERFALTNANASRRAEVRFVEF